jgi:hypothetical protein
MNRTVFGPNSVRFPGGSRKDPHHAPGRRVVRLPVPGIFHRRLGRWTGSVVKASSPGPDILHPYFFPSTPPAFPVRPSAHPHQTGHELIACS